jgi:hypothetical protein
MATGSDKPKLPKGDGDLKTNAQVFGLIGRQFQEISAMNRTLGTLGEAQGLIAEALTKSAEAGVELGERQIKAMENVAGILNTIEGVIRPISTRAEEANEGGLTTAQPQSAPGAAGGAAAAETGKGLLSMGGDAKTAGKGFGFLEGAGKGVAAVLKGVGATALMIGGAFLLAGIAVKKVGEGFQEIAVGLDDLNDLDLLPEKFEAIGQSLAAMAAPAGISGALALKLLSGSAFKDMAEGMEALNDAEFDPANLERVGKGLGAMLDPLGGQESAARTLQMIDDNLGDVAVGIQELANVDVPAGFSESLTSVGVGLGGMLDGIGTQWLDAGTLQMVDDNLVPLAEGVQKLVSIDFGSADVEEKFGAIGLAIGSLLDGIGGWSGNALDASTLQMIDDNLIPLADGVTRLNQLDTDTFTTKAPLIGTGMQAILDGTDDLLGAQGMQMIDDNLAPLSVGIDRVNLIDADRFLRTAIRLGPAFQVLLDGTDDIMGAQGMQMIDDNLIPLADGIDRLNELEVDPAKFANIGEGLDAILDGISNTDDDKGFFGNFFDGAEGAVDRARAMSIAAEPINILADALANMSEIDGDLDAEKIKSDVVAIATAANALSDEELKGGFDKFNEFVGNGVFRNTGLKALADVDATNLAAVVDSLQKLNLASGLDANFQIGGGQIDPTGLDNTEAASTTNIAVPTVNSIDNSRISAPTTHNRNMTQVINIPVKTHISI